MPSLNLDLNFFDHPKVKRLRALAGSGAEIYLIRLWAYAGKFHSEDGVLKDYSVPEIEGLIEWKGKSGIMIEAMLKVGFIEKSGQGHKIHDWAEHEGHLVVYKTRSRLANAARWKKSSLVKNASSNPKGIVKESPIRSVHCSSVQSTEETTPTSAPAKPGADGSKPVNWDNCRSDLQRLIAHYIKSEMPELYKIGTQAQATALFKRYGRPASELLSVSGDLPTAKRAFDLAMAYFRKKGLSWNLSTVTSNSAEFVNAALQEKSKV